MKENGEELPQSLSSGTLAPITLAPNEEHESMELPNDVGGLLEYEDAIGQSSKTLADMDIERRSAISFQSVSRRTTDSSTDGSKKNVTSRLKTTGSRLLNQGRRLRRKKGDIEDNDDNSGSPESSEIPSIDRYHTNRK